MKFTRKLSIRRALALIGVLALSVAGLVGLPATAHAAVACNVTYTASNWGGGNGFTASVTINNTGDPITQWTLRFAFPGSQQVTQGWGATWAQSGSQVTAKSLSYNGALGTGASTNIGFNGTFSGTNTAPTSFTVNGTACNGGGGGGNQAPTVSLTSPTSGAAYAAGAAVPLAATASDPGGAVARVEFLVDGTVVGTDTTSPYSFSVTGLASGSHTAQARAFDNGTPALSATTAAVSFTVGGTSTPSIVPSSTSVTVPEGGTQTVNVRLSAAPTGNVTVTLTRTGDTSITVSPATFTRGTGNWNTGQNITVSAAEDPDTTNGTAAIAIAASGYTGVTVNVTEADNDGGGGGGRVDNPYAGAGVYVNPEWSAKAAAEPGGSRVSNQPTGVWLDRIAAINGVSGGMGLRAHLDRAVQQAAGSPFVIQLVIYNLPGRDCAALASNGELGPTDLPRYKSEYIDPIAAILADPAYRNLRIVTVIEIDSLPNLVTNTGSRATATPQCDTMLANGNYVNGVGYALAKLGAVPNVYNYIDAGHHGWIGWDDNFGPSATLFAQAANASGSTPANVHGFISNTANYGAVQEPYFTINDTVNGTSVRQSSWVDWNRYVDELTFAQGFRQRLVQAGFAPNVGMLIDTSRNGWGGSARPTGPGPQTSVDAYVDGGRLDRRIHLGNWCNQAGAGIGERPRSGPAAGIDAYVWIKPPGESDGSSQAIDNDEGKGFDRMCDPTYTGNPRNNNHMSGALPNAPLSGHWFSAQFQELMRNAYPPLQ
jgi:cellulose 1,4-beta-cellobiosidase